MFLSDIELRFYRFVRFINPLSRLLWHQNYNKNVKTANKREHILVNVLDSKYYIEAMFTIYLQI